MSLKRYWLAFELAVGDPGLKQFGITAWAYDDAISLLKETFKLKELPTVSTTIENADITTLDKGHVIPNMGAPSVRGIWFPLL
jgi:hypothetical protein